MKTEAKGIKTNETNLSKVKNKPTPTDSDLNKYLETEIQGALKESLLKLQELLSRITKDEQHLFEHVTCTLDENVILELLAICQDKANYKADAYISGILIERAIKGDTQALKLLKNSPLLNKSHNDPALKAFTELLEKIANRNGGCTDAELIEVYVLYYITIICTKRNIETAQELLIQAINAKHMEICLLHDIYNSLILYENIDYAFDRIKSNFSTLSQSFGCQYLKSFLCHDTSKLLGKFE